MIFSFLFFYDSTSLETGNTCPPYSHTTVIPKPFSIPLFIFLWHSSFHTPFWLLDHEIFWLFIIKYINIKIQKFTTNRRAFFMLDCWMSIRSFKLAVPYNSYVGNLLRNWWWGGTTYLTCSVKIFCLFHFSFVS